MNEYYAVYGKNGFVIDENNKKTAINNSKNLPSILVKENEIEEIEQNLEEANNVSLDAKNDLKFYKKLLKCISVITLPLVILLGNYISLNIGLIAFFVSLTQLSILGIYKVNKKESERILHSAELQSFFLEKAITKAKNELKQLKYQDEDIVYEKSLNLEKVDDKKVLTDLRYQLLVLKIYGEHLEKYADKYAKGLWGTKEKEQANKDGIDGNLLEQYLNEYNTQKLLRTKDKKIS